MRTDDGKRKRFHIPPKSLGKAVQKGVARGEVFVKDFPKTSPRPPLEWESEERHLGIEKTVEHGGSVREV